MIAHATVGVKTTTHPVTLPTSLSLWPTTEWRAIRRQMNKRDALVHRGMLPNCTDIQWMDSMADGAKGGGSLDYCCCCYIYNCCQAASNLTNITLSMDIVRGNKRDKRL